MKPFYFAILAAVVWGIAPILEKTGLGRIEPMAGVIIRSFGVLLGAIVLALFNSNIIKVALRADQKTIIFLVLGGIIASILGQIFFYNALKTGEVSKMVPIAATYPLVSFLLGLLFFGESLTVAKGLGIGFVILGVFFLR
ncbi:MAG: EamA family transporter [Candidatus Omnitrophota bacterium]|nr:EamA family transporter [Candidatus Omnitrophota bacterium]